MVLFGLTQVLTAIRGRRRSPREEPADSAGRPRWRGWLATLAAAAALVVANTAASCGSGPA
jgi:hypothetical protein